MAQCGLCAAPVNSDATSNDPVSAPDELIWKIIHAASVGRYRLQPVHHTIAWILYRSMVGSNNYAFVNEILWRRINDAAYPRHIYKARCSSFDLACAAVSSDDAYLGYVRVRSSARAQGLTLLYHLLQHGENKNIFRRDTKGDTLP